MMRGFTLLEVLIALAITALALTMGFVAVRDGAHRLVQVETTTLAGWALENLAAEIALGGLPSGGRDAPHRETLLGHEFLTRVERLDDTRVRLSTTEAGNPREVLVEGDFPLPHAPAKP